MPQMAAGVVGQSMHLFTADSKLPCLYRGLTSPAFPVRCLSWRCGSNYMGETLLAFSKLQLEKPSSPLFGTSSNRGFIRQQLYRKQLCLASREPSTVESSKEVKSGEIVEQEVEEALPEHWKWSKTTGELVAYGLLLAAVPIVPMIPKYEWSGAFYFLFLAVWSVYVGSHRSLGKKPPQKVSLKQGLVVPLFCSASLFGFYCLLRFFPDLDLRTFISAYLGVAGAAAVASNLAEPLRLLLPTPDSTSWKIDMPKWLVQDDGSSVEVSIAPADIIAVAVGIGATIASKQEGAPYTLKNLIAVCIVTELLQLLSLGSFTTAAAMQSGLLLYDVFWVFGSSHIFGDNVMVTVATSSAFDGPMKLIFPQFKEGSLNPYSILGLGDIAAPGLLIALMLRFDRSRVKGLSSSTDGNGVDSSDSNETPDKTYFVTCLASYIFGLTLTVVANTVSGAAQPALLYLVPCLLCGVFFVAASRSETPLLLGYQDETQMSPVPIESEDRTD
ncbi:unnamed protein product [Calypogeia fissa]